MSYDDSLNSSIRSLSEKYWISGKRTKFDSAVVTQIFDDLDKRNFSDRYLNLLDYLHYLEKYILGTFRK